MNQRKLYLLLAVLMCGLSSALAQVTWTSSTSIETTLSLGGDPTNLFSPSTVTLGGGSEDGQTSFYDGPGNKFYLVSLGNGPSDNFRIYINNQGSGDLFISSGDIVITLVLPESDEGQIGGWDVVKVETNHAEKFSADFSLGLDGVTTLTLTQIEDITLLAGSANAIDFTRNFTIAPAPVPEPASVALLAGLACAGFAATRRRRA